MKRNHAAHWSLNLALYEALHGQAPQALLALQAAQKTAEGSLHVRPLSHNAARALLLLHAVRAHLLHCKWPYSEQLC
jgi:hypothetical protein